MPTYEKVPKKVDTLITRVIKQHQPELQAAKVQVVALFAYAARDGADNPVGVALKHHGRQAAAVIRILPLKLRAHGLADVEILIDGDRWPDLSPSVKAALIDHELEHIRPVWETWPDSETESEGVPRKDDLNRPKLRTQAHDWEIAGFYSVIERHGRGSIEAHQLSQLQGQLLLPFMREMSDSSQPAELTLTG